MTASQNVSVCYVHVQGEGGIPVMEREEPPLQAEIMMRSSMTLSLILLALPQLQTSTHACIASNVLSAATLHHEHILIADRRFCRYNQLHILVLAFLLDELISTEVSPLLNFFSSTSDGFCPSRSHMASTSFGWEEPEKMVQPRMFAIFSQAIGDGIGCYDCRRVVGM